MSCERFREALVDDLPDPAVESHARECADCAALLAGDRRLARAVQRWKAASPAPPAGLEARILAALGGEKAEVVRIRPPRRALGGSIWRWATAALLLVGAAVTLQQLLPRSDEHRLVELIRQIEQVERRHTEAIAELEREGMKRLARATDPALPPAEAAMLLSYRDRLTHLDSVIDEVREFLAETPGHSGGHTVLLAAYEEKADLLQELLELPLGESS